MSTEQIPQFERPLPVEPEAIVKNYKHALKEERIALKGGGLFDKALGAAFGWDPMPAYRFNEAMRGVEREKKLAKSYSETNLDILQGLARKEMEATSSHKFDDGTVPPDYKEFPENRHY